MQVKSLSYSQARRMVRQILGPQGRIWKRSDAGAMRLECGFELGDKPAVVARADSYLELVAALSYVLKMDEARAHAAAESLEAHGIDAQPIVEGKVADVEK